MSSLGRTAAFERLEERTLLAVIVETGKSFGSAVTSAYALHNDSIFEIDGSITRNDVDFFKIEAAAGGHIEVDAQAKPLEFEAEPTLRVLSTAEGYLWRYSLGWPTYAQMVRDPGNIYNQHHPPEWQEWKGVSPVSDNAGATIIHAAVTGAFINAAIAGSITNPKETRFEWEILSEISGELIPDIECNVYNDDGVLIGAWNCNRFIDLKADNRARVGIDWSSNYSGEIATSLGTTWPNVGTASHHVYQQGKFDRSFPENADLDVSRNDKWNHHWEFTPDELSPVIGLFDGDGNLLYTSSTGHLDYWTNESGTYYVAISRNSLFEPTTDEDRFYHRPYDATIKVPVDLSVEAVTVDTENRGLRVEYTAFNFRPDDLPIFEAYWAAGPSVSDIIADAQIDTWAPSAKEGSRLIGLSELANAPADATHVVVVADREDQVTEVNESNNDRAIAVIQDPTVEVIIGDGGWASSPNAGPSYMKEEWSVWVQVTNNSLIPHTFQLGQEYTYTGVYLQDGQTALGREDGFYQGFHPPGFDHTPSGLGTEIVLGALATSGIERSSSAVTTWHWLPTDSKLVVPHVFDFAMEPITDALGLFQTAMGFKSRVIGQLIAQEADGAVGSVLRGLKSYTDFLGPFVELYTIYESFSKEIHRYPYVEFAIETSVRRDGHVLPISVVSDERVQPRSSREWHLALARGEIALAKIAFGNVLSAKGLARAGWFLAGGIASVELARYFYEQAQDPPDPDYTSRVPSPEVETTELADLSDDRLRAWFEAERSRVALSTAAYLAQNKADGAALAGDFEWQARQLIDSAAFDRDAAFVAGRSMALANLVAPLLNEADRSPAEVLAQLQSQGLPEDVQHVLVEAGWSDTDIETMLASLTEKQIAAPNALADGIRSNAVPTVLALLDKLRQVTEIRVQEGSGGLAIPAADMDAPAEMRDRIDVGLVNGASAVELMGLSESYIRRTTDLVVETNNWDALQPDLQFGYLSLLMIQDGLRSDAIAVAIDRLEAAGTGAEHVAYFRQQDDLVQGYAQSADWIQMGAVLETTATYVLEHWGGELPNAEAYRLFGQLMTARSLALGDDLSSAPEPASDKKSFVALAGLPESLTPISTLGGTGLTYHGISATRGTVDVDHDGTAPQIRYTPDADASGPERLSYVVIDPNTWQFQAVHADGQISPALRWGDDTNHGQVTSESTVQLAFAADRGDGLVLEQMDAGGPLSVRVISAADGEVVAEGVIPWNRSFTVPYDGKFLLQISSFFQTATEFEIRAKLVHAEFAPLETGNIQSGFISSGEQVAFSISVEAPDVLYYDAIGNGGWRSTTLSVLSPTGTFFSGSDFEDSGLLWADEVGEYVFIIRNDEPEEVEYNFRVLAGSNATPLELGESLSTQILAPRGTRLFVLEDTSASAVVLDDLGSTPYEGRWEIPSRGNTDFGGWLGRDGVAILDTRNATVVVIESFSMDPVDVQFAVRELTPLDLSVVKDATVQLELPSGSVTRVAFDAQQDEVLLFDSLVPQSTSSYAEVYLERPGGEIQWLSDAAWDSSAFRTAVTGEHRLIFVNSQEGETIDFRILSLSNSQQITATTGMWQREFLDSEEIHGYQFVATEGMPVQLSIRSPSSAYWEVHSASGEFVDFGFWHPASGTNLFDVRVFEPGNFFLTVGTWEDAESSYEIQLFGLAGGNHAPVAQDATAVASGDGGPVAGQLVADDVDSDDTPATLIYALVSGPGEGSAIVNSDGSFTFDPGSDFQDLAAGETRDVTFTFEATDSHAEVSNLAKVVVTVTGVNESPSQPEDVTDRVTTNFYGRQFNRRTGVYGFYASITNNAEAQLVYPIRLLLSDLGPAGTTIENAHGTLEDGTPYFDFTGTAALAPGEMPEAVVIAIKPPSQTLYTFTSQVLAVVMDGGGINHEVDEPLTMSSFQNPHNRFDVNADGIVSPLDALIVINHLHRGSNLIAVDMAAAIDVTASHLIDVNDDGKASPLDALLIINELNRRTRADRVSAAQGELRELARIAPPAEPALETSVEERERLLDDVYTGLARESVELLTADFTQQAVNSMVPVVAGDAEEEESSRAPDEGVMFNLVADLPWLD